MDRLFFNAICDMTTITMERYLTDEALIDFVAMVIGDSDAKEYYKVIYDENDKVIGREIEDRDFLFIAIREWRKQGLLEPF